MSNYKQLKKQGQQLYRENRYEQCIIKLKQLLSLISQQFHNKEIKDQKQGRYLIKTMKLPSLKLISQCQFTLLKYQECLVTCDRILKIDNDYVNAMYMKGIIYIQQNKINESLQLFQRCCILQPDNQTYKQKLQFIKNQCTQKLNFNDKLLIKMSKLLGVILSVLAITLSVWTFGLKILYLVFVFVRNNLERLWKIIRRFACDLADIIVNLFVGVWRGMIGIWRGIFVGCKEWIGKRFGRKQNIL